MVARGALIKPWLFREARRGTTEDVGAEERVDLYRRYVQLAKNHWGEDDHGLTRVREFTRWHTAFWCRYRPPRPDGTFPSMQERESGFAARTPLEALLSRGDDAALDYVVDCLVADRPMDPNEAPPLLDAAAEGAPSPAVEYEAEG
jgi:tRNA-dihydrouridine synthase 3